MAGSSASDSRAGSAPPTTAAGGTYSLEVRCHVQLTPNKELDRMSAPSEKCTCLTRHMICHHPLQSIIVGCKIFVQKPTSQGQMEERKAEILSVRDVSKMQYGRPAPVASTAEGATAPTKEYYVHYVEFNKRLDEWIPSTRLLLGRELEWPVPAKPKKGAASSALDSGTNTPAGSPARPQSLLKKATKAGSFSSQQPAAASKSKSKSSKKKTGDPDAGMDDAEGEDDEDLLASTDPSTVAEQAVASGSLAAPSNPRAAPAVFSKADEIEKLRTGGSMTQSHGEISRVKNLNRIQIGGHEVEAWYFSAYPKEYAHIPVLYICEMCLSFYPSPMMLGRHRVKCTLHHPPGNEIYRHDDISFYEIDGRRQKTWCRNLCLLSKMFLDHKTLYYDVVRSKPRSVICMPAPIPC